MKFLLTVFLIPWVFALVSSRCLQYEVSRCNQTHITYFCALDDRTGPHEDECEEPKPICSILTTTSTTTTPSAISTTSRTETTKIKVSPAPIETWTTTTPAAISTASSIETTKMKVSPAPIDTPHFSQHTSRCPKALNWTNCSISVKFPHVSCTNDEDCEYLRSYCCHDECFNYKICTNVDFGRVVCETTKDAKKRNCIDEIKHPIYCTSNFNCPVGAICCEDSCVEPQRKICKPGVPSAE